MDCEHKRIHTERLWKEKPTVNDKTGDISNHDYVIESICADCGLFLKVANVHSKRNH